jgi:hypoxanthine phosphoribosyltransferase
VVKVKVNKSRILFDSDTIAARIREIGREISDKHRGEEVVIIGVLKGCFMFMADLVRAIELPTKIDFVRISSYHNSTCSSGVLEIKMDVSLPLKGKAIILVDDIVDTGLTLSEYKKRLEAEQPKSLETAALIDKKARREKHVDLDYCGFQIEDGFVVGFGLDCDEQHRGLGSLYVLEEHLHT